jgi:putative oxidoreductase
MKFMKAFEEPAYAALRMVSGFAFCIHGFQKVLGLFGGPLQPAFTQLWVGGCIELGCGSLIFLGLRTRWAAFLASGTMAVAYCQFHWKFQLGEAFLPAVNKGELALIYCFLFLFIAARGADRWALDKRD